MWTHSRYDPSYDADGNWHYCKFGKPLHVRRAIYRTKDWKTINDEPSITVDVTDVLNAMIVNDRLAIPSDYNSIFGDPKKGVKKQLVIWFSYKHESGYTFVDEGTKIWAFIYLTNHDREGLRYSDVTGRAKGDF